MACRRVIGLQTILLGMLATVGSTFSADLGPGPQPQTLEPEAVRTRRVLCRQCAIEGKTVAASHVGHVEPHKGECSLFQIREHSKPPCSPSQEASPRLLHKADTASDQSLKVCVIGGTAGHDVRFESKRTFKPAPLEVRFVPRTDIELICPVTGSCGCGACDSRAYIRAVPTRRTAAA
jgi:hypothetical protein